jgi:hypothetical protein
LRDEIAGGWRKLHDEGLHNSYSWANTIRMIKPRRMRWGEHVAVTREKMNSYRVVEGKREDKRPLGRYRHG